MAYQSVNPYDGKILKTFKELTDNQLETALGNAATCFDNWRHTTFAGRAAVVTKAAAIMRARTDEFARPMTLEMGKLIAQARGEVVLSADIFDYYAKNAERFLAPQHLEPGSGEAEIESSPFGVLFGVEPGKLVAARAGQNLKKSTMELGGSDAFIVLEDADLDQTVKWAVWAKMNNMGQCCVAAKRFIVVEELADRFLDKFRTALAALTPGNPLDETTTLGPLSTEAALVKLLDQVKRALAEGATLVMGGKRIDRPGSFMQPTILANIKPGNPAYREELFGPVALLFRVNNEDEAVALANDSDFGLGGSVFTKDIARGKRVASRIDTGMVFVNHPTWTTPDLPFGGIKDSGYGRELSSMGIQEFVNKKLVRVASIDAPA